MTLLELQRRMAADVQRPLTDDFAMQAADEQGVPLSEIAGGYIKPNPRLTSFDRLEIYNRQYWFRVIGAVSEDYPALNAVLGEKKFDALVLAYLKQNPSTSFTLRNLGAKLPEWLAAHPELAAPRHNLAVDVARLEWAYVESYDLASRTPLGLEDFAGLGPDSTLRLQPHVQLLNLQYPVDEIVLAVRKATPEMDIVSNAVSERKHAARIPLPKVRKGNVHLAVHRFDNLVYYRRIDREAFLLLAALREGNSIANALARAFSNTRLTAEKQAAKTQEYFAHAAELGWFCHSDPEADSKTN
jgi:Putative DNA-binding domain